MLYSQWLVSKTYYKFFDRIAEERYKNIKQQVGDMEISINGYNLDEDLFTVLVSDDKTPGIYYLYDK